MNDVLKPASDERWLMLYGQRSLQFLDFSSTDFSYRMLDHNQQYSWSSWNVKHAILGSPTSGCVITASVY